MFKRQLLQSHSFAALALIAMLAGPALAQPDQSGPPPQGPPYFSPDQLDQMLAPIALYPDPLLAQVLPACAYPEEIDQAAHFVQAYGPAQVDQQPWDGVVRAVAHYPQVISMLDQNLDWTAGVGQAFAYQMSDVTMSIQRLRLTASNAGNLVNGPQELVQVQDNFITITPANPSLIYVPSYDPAYAYSANPYGYERPAVSFSVGIGGAWLNFGVDWLGGCVVPYPRGTYWGPGGWHEGRGFTNINYIHDRYNRDDRNYYRIDRQRFAQSQLPNQQGGSFARHYAPAAPHPVSSTNGFQNRPAFQGNNNRPAATQQVRPNRTPMIAPTWHPSAGVRGSVPRNQQFNTVDPRTGVYHPVQTQPNIVRQPIQTRQPGQPGHNLNPRDKNKDKDQQH
jgi:hypothetical protein